MEPIFSQIVVEASDEVRDISKQFGPLHGINISGPLSILWFLEAGREASQGYSHLPVVVASLFWLQSLKSRLAEISSFLRIAPQVR
jgi:hypothetical protein